MTSYNAKCIKERSAVYNKYNGRCAYCGCILYKDSFHIDHIIPKRRYKDVPLSERSKIIHGSDDYNNLMPSCASCNSSKSDLSIESFRYRVLERVERLNKTSVEYNIAKRFGLVVETNKPIVFYFETYNQ